MLYTVGKLSALESRKSSHFLWRVIRRDAMEHDKIDTVLLVWAATSVHNEIKTKVISSGYLSLIDVIWDTINCRFLQSFQKLIEQLQWWLVPSSSFIHLIGENYGYLDRFISISLSHAKYIDSVFCHPSQSFATDHHSILSNLKKYWNC